MVAGYSKIVVVGTSNYKLALGRSNFDANSQKLSVLSKAERTGDEKCFGIRTTNAETKAKEFIQQI